MLYPSIWKSGAPKQKEVHNEKYLTFITRNVITVHDDNLFTTIAVIERPTYFQTIDSKGNK